METLNIYQKLFEIKKAGIKLQRDTKAFNYQYATLSQIQEKLNWEFEKQQLLVTHSIIENKVSTRITNIEWKLWDFISSEIEMTAWTKAQDKGSEITYYRRYNLLSLLDLEVEDDDGKKAQDSKPKKEAKWYNDVDKNIDKWFDMVADWKTTWQAIVDKIEWDGFSLSKANKDKILWIK